MSSSPLPPLKLIFLLTLIPFTISISFTYPTFNQASQGIQYQGHAGFSNNSIHLTTTTQPSSFGRAVYYQSVPVWNSDSSDHVTDFTTSFSFIVDESNGNDGLAFFLAPYPSMVPASSDGTYLALFNGSLDTIQPSKIMAVEFDSAGVSPESSNQNLVKSNTTINNSSVTTVTLNSSLTQGVTALATVNYKYSTRNFTVSVNYPTGTMGKKNWTVSHICDLKETLPSEVVVGFSSSMNNNNNSSQPHRILSWNFTSTLEKNNITKTKKNKLAPGLGLGFSLAILVSLFACLIFWRRKVRKNKRQKYSISIDQSISALNQGTGQRRFTYTQLINATKTFSEDRKLGGGGSGEVYKGVLTNPNLEIAVKKISSSEKGKKEYISEVTIISRIRHRNLVQLLGFCHERGDLLLVYEYMSNGSLDTHLYNNEKVLGWSERCKIVSGLASALLYLHEECEQCVVHRDIKPSNVMLDMEFNPKLGDFGLARLMDHDHGSLTTRFAGTFGYIAPEYGTSGKASRETDIFSFGVVTLEILCGRKPIQRNQDEQDSDLIQWAWENYGASSPLSVVDQRLDTDFDEAKMERMIGIGLWCAHPDCTQRPTIRQVINVLNSDGNLPKLPARMPVLMYRQPFSVSEGSSSQNPESGEVFSFSSMSNSAFLGR
ncbi:hypothetical protein LUZ60_000877 [Juncus effusus]|nr:hypothetical protein LUZ60_000877 [Juncus effusus]